MDGFVPSIHVHSTLACVHVGSRDEPGHDGGKGGDKKAADGTLVLPNPQFTSFKLSEPCTLTSTPSLAMTPSRARVWATRPSTRPWIILFPSGLSAPINWSQRWPPG